MFSKKFLSLLAAGILAIGFSACQKPASVQGNSNASPDAKHYPFKGKIISVDKSKNTATISHDAVPEISMDAMTMPFPIKDTWVMDVLAPGAQINADLVVDKGDFYLEHVSIVALPNPDQTPPPPTDKAGGTIEGANLPDFTLTNQDGKRINTKDFRGKALAITFIYTKCPLPNYCPLMSLNFSQIALDVQKNPELKNKIRLLSISFDPKNDTPAVLKTFGAGYLGKDTKPDFTVWQLATGSEADVAKVADFFGLSYQLDPNDKAQFIHSLRTIVIDPQGKVTKVYSGSDWTVAELTKALQDAATQS